MWKCWDRRFLFHMCSLPIAIWNTFGKFAKIGQAHYVITAFAAAEENSDALDDCSLFRVCLFVSNHNGKNTSKLWVFEI